MAASELRQRLSDELHARAFHDFAGAGRFIRFVYLTEQEEPAVIAYINTFLENLGQSALSSNFKFVRLELDGYVLRVERHTEFFSVSFVQKGETQKTGLSSKAFDISATGLPIAWARNLPAPLFTAIWLEIGGKAPRNIKPNGMLDVLESRAVAANYFSDESAQVHFAFDVDKDGFSRIALYNEAISSDRMGRTVQRIVELETYRLLALLGFAAIQEHSPQLAQLEQLVANLTKDLAAQIKRPDSQMEQLLQLLSAQAADLEEIYSQTSYRMAATKAYETILNDRLEGLRLTRLSGFQGVRGFLRRRMSPAMDSCRAFDARLTHLSQRISRAGDLLRTQTEMLIQNQNRDLLHSMNDRSRDQLRLQLTVERLSIAAVTYYGVGLVGYLASALPLSQWNVDVIYIKAAAVPVIAFTVYAAIRSVHKR